MIRRLKLIASLLIYLPTLLFGDQDEEVLPWPIGNFSVPTATQIAPLVSFGQLQVGKGVALPQLIGTYIRETNGYDNVISPSIIFGLRDDLNLYLVAPYTTVGRAGSSHSSGINDIYAQLEYTVFNKTCISYILQSTIVAGVQFPTGSISKSPPTGTGSFL